MMIKKRVFIGPLLLMAAWWIVSAFKLVDAFFLPGPIATFLELGKMIISGTILPDLFATLTRVAIAFIISLIIGLPLGLLLGVSRKTYERFEFVIDFFRSIPATAMFPLFLLVFGIDDKSKIAVAAFTSTLLILFNTAHGVMHSKKSRIFAAKLMGATKFQIFKHILFWESLPQIFIGLRTAVSVSLTVIIVTEMFIGTLVGLGHSIIEFQYIYNIKGLYAVILLTGVIGYLLNTIFTFAENKFVHWTGK
jgi:ABC-type nitrate/sulfonate/bicarbonate transport system permease component